MLPGGILLAPASGGVSLGLAVAGAGFYMGQLAINNLALFDFVLCFFLHKLRRS
jgi:hypothetical protein